MLASTALRLNIVLVTLGGALAGLAQGLPLATCPTIGCLSTTVSGQAATAMGYHTNASGNYGSVAMGDNTHATGGMSAAFGSGTVAACGGDYPAGIGCVSMGHGITNNETQSLAVSGNVTASGFRYFGADARLSKNVKAADPATLLANIEKLDVVTRAPSDHYCKHQGRAPAECAGDRAVGLLAQQVGAVIPEAVGSGASLALVDSA